MANELEASGRTIDVRLNSSRNLSAPTPGSHIIVAPSYHPRIEVRRQFLVFRWNGTQAA
jgi:hypothetical protein